MAFSNGITQFDDVIYWTQPLKVNRKIGNDVQVIYTGPNNETFRDIEVVHPRSQPTGKISFFKNQSVFCNTILLIKVFAPLQRD